MSNAPTHDSSLAKDVAGFCLQQVPDPQQSRSSFPKSELWAAVARTGTSLWLDTGDVDAARELWVQEFVALTTNNTLLNKEVQKGIYDELVPYTAKLLADKGVTGDDVVQEIAFVLNAVHGLKLVRTFDADVSVELHTAISNDAEASYQYGKRFHAICPDRFIVKVPLTPAGLLAARRLSDDGIRLNFTLGFSARQNWLIASLAKPSWVNVFMGRINAFLSDNDLGDGKNAGEKATLASQRGLRRLKNQGGADVRQIGASMRNGNQVDDLLGLDVFTMPTGAAKGFVDLNPDPAKIVDKTGNDPEVLFAQGVDVDADRLNCFWDIGNEFETAAANAAGLNPSTATADDVLAVLRDGGAGDLFPQFSAAEAAQVASEGKIPVYKSWVERVRAGTCSWDGVLTAAALASFTQDQTALDDRIRSLLK
ncbi:MAG: transaldolase family protein [Planctomycetes bacterium]|nr:transaldolase family protein [Planctomycetota bacterium]